METGLVYKYDESKKVTDLSGHEENPAARVHRSLNNSIICHGSALKIEYANTSNLSRRYIHPAKSR